MIKRYHWVLQRGWNNCVLPSRYGVLLTFFRLNITRITLWNNFSDQQQHGEPGGGGGRHQQQSCHRGRRCPAHTAPQIIACIEEGSSVDSGNLGSIQKELEEELKGSARRSSGLWRRGIAGRWEGGEHSPWGHFFNFVLVWGFHVCLTFTFREPYIKTFQ